MHKILMDKFLPRSSFNFTKSVKGFIPEHYDARRCIMGRQASTYFEPPGIPQKKLILSDSKIEYFSKFQYILTSNSWNFIKFRKNFKIRKNMCDFTEFFQKTFLQILNIDDILSPLK